MILSRTAVYALRATLCLADHDPSVPVRVDDLAEEIDVPRNYLSKILNVLARESVLTSTRGPGGGFRLATAPTDLLISDVVRHFDSVPDESTCLLSERPCSQREPCSVHRRWAGLSEAVSDFLRQTSLADLVARDPALPIESG